MKKINSRFLIELEQKAKLATPGPWKLYRDEPKDCGQTVCNTSPGTFNRVVGGPVEPIDNFALARWDESAEANVQYIKSVSPDVILAMISRLIYLERREENK